MTPSDDRTERAGIRSEPEPFRMAVVEAVHHLTPYMARVSLLGEALKEMETPEPAASIRLLLPMPGSRELPELHWNGNEYRLEDGSRPVIRTFTPGNFDADAGRLDIEVVLHDAGATSLWLRSAEPGAVAAVSGPGRGYSIDRDATAYALAGDATALPAVCQLIDAIPADTALRVIVEVDHEEARMELPFHPRLDCHWAIRRPQQKPGAALLKAIREVEIAAGATIWAAGEAGAMFDVRKYFLEERGFDRRRVTVRGYWKQGR